MTSKLRSYCRFHETSPKNQPIGAQPIYDISPNTNTFTIEKTSITLKNYTLESKKSRYKFDKIFDENGENSLFIEIMRPIIRDAYITHKKAVLMALGLSNSGKTHTILGNNENPGLLQTTIEALLTLKKSFDDKNSKSNELLRKKEIEEFLLNNELFVFEDFSIFFEAYEVYNEEVYDLLTEKRGNKLDVKEFNKKTYVLNLSHTEIKDFAFFKGIISKFMNNTSRSHNLYKITINLKYQSEKNIKELQIPILFVDLVGINNPNSKENPSDIYLKENGNINKSVFFLNRCLHFYLSDKTNNNQQDFFRESKLTLLIFEFLMENSNKSLIFHINAINQLTDFKENQSLMEDIGIFGEKKEKKLKNTVDPIKFEVSKSLKKSEKNLNSFMDNMRNSMEDRQGEYLSKFIKSSTTRVNMIKAGRRLDNLVSSDAEHYIKEMNQINKIFQKDEKKLQKKKRKKKQNQENISLGKPHQIIPIINTIIPTPAHQTRPQTQSKLETKSNFNNTDKNLNKTHKSRGVSGVQLNKYKDLMKETKNLSPFITNYSKSPVFEKGLEVEKFKNLKQFYNEKFKLMSKYLSEEDLNKFISKTDQNLIMHNQNSQILNPKAQEDNENLEILKFLEKEEEKSESRIKKILKINTEIQTQLLKEDHINKLQQLQELRLQQNRQLFKLIDELPSKFSNSNDQYLFIHRRPETSDDCFLKRNFLRYKPPKTQQNQLKSYKMENLSKYNPNIDPKNLLFENLLTRDSNLNINNIKNSYIDKEKENSGSLIRACTSDAKYRSLKAIDCKNSWKSNMQILKKEQDIDVVFINKEKGVYDEEFKEKRDKENIKEINQNMQENNLKIMHPSAINIKKIHKDEHMTEKITLEKWKSLPDSLRNLILLKNQENPDDIKEIDMPKYLTKFNQTKYKLKNNKKSDKNDNNEKKIYKENNNNNEQDGFELQGIAAIKDDYRRDYAIYKEKALNNWLLDNDEKLNIFNYIDSREWNNNF